MPARNLLTDECLIAHRHDRPTDRPIPVSGMNANNTLSGSVGLISPSGICRLASLEDGVLLARFGAFSGEILPLCAPSWTFVVGSDADLAAIRAAGYAVEDGRVKG